jgi:Rrf2 family protein
MMLDLAERYDQGPVQMGDISKRQDISLKYLEQLIIPLKKAGFIESVRGPKGGHMLTRHPREISVGEIIRLLENDTSLSRCVDRPETCEKSEACPTRAIWDIATHAMYDKLNSVSLDDMV